MTNLKKVKEDWGHIIYKDGKLDEEQILKELADYSFLMHQVAIVYEHVAGLSKTKSLTSTTQAAIN